MIIMAAWFNRLKCTAARPRRKVNENNVNFKFELIQQAKRSRTKPISWMACACSYVCAQVSAVSNNEIINDHLRIRTQIWLTLVGGYVLCVSSIASHVNRAHILHSLTHSFTETETLNRLSQNKNKFKYWLIFHLGARPLKPRNHFMIFSPHLSVRARVCEHDNAKVFTFYQ